MKTRVYVGNQKQKFSSAVSVFSLIFMQDQILMELVGTPAITKKKKRKKDKDKLNIVYSPLSPLLRAGLCIPAYQFQSDHTVEQPFRPGAPH